ncbi:MAG TPA: nitrilase-related carbon-nitrogen hydrolase [Solirubrobacteraceae bacterium]|nr:nitrilase-related carbon-nitrogen hydrolase [Solirubrobacteraceae bacterium]
MSTIQVACCQTLPDVEDPRASAARARAALAAAVASGAQIVVLPELAHSGYIFTSAQEARAAAIPAGGELLAGWAQEASRGDAVVIGGFCELGDDGRVFNSAAVVDRDGVLAVYRKLHLWHDEASWFTPGERPAPVVETRHGAVGVGVCYDIEFPELTRGLALAGAELIALPMNWPREDRPGAAEPTPHLLARATAFFSHVYVAVCDRGGEERGARFQGASVIAGPRGASLAAAAPGAGAETVRADCDLGATRDKRTGPRNDAIADRRPQHYMASSREEGSRG